MAGGMIVQVKGQKKGLYVKKRYTVQRPRLAYRAKRFKPSKANATNRLHLGVGNSGAVPVPDRKRIKFSYADIYNLGTPAVGTTVGTEQLIQLNSLFHPDGSNAGHQPYGYDQFFPALYLNYRVYGVYVDLTFTDPSADGLYWVVNAGEGMLSGRTMNLVMEMNDVARGVLNNTGSQVVHYRQYLPIHKVNGEHKLTVLTDPDYAGSSGASPVHLALLRMAIGKLVDSDGASKSMKCICKLTFYAEAYFKQQLAQS